MKIKEIRRTFDLLDLYNTDYKELENAFVYKNKVTKEWTNVSAEKYYKMSHKVACGLLKIGLKKGDKVLSTSASLPHWNIVDMACSMLGIIHIPIYSTLGQSEMEKIYSHCDAKLAFITNEDLYKKSINIIKEKSQIEHVFSFYKVEGIDSIIEVANYANEEEEKEYLKQIEEIKATISEDDCTTIIYTSGTTGDPKGVMLSHKNILRNMESLLWHFPNNYGDHCFSFLPLCHIYERTLNYSFQWKGSSIYYAEGLGTLLSDLQYAKPTTFNSVPRVLEKFYTGIIAKGKDLKGIKKIIFFWAIRLGYKFNDNGDNSAYYKFKLKIARKLVFSQIYKTFGGKVKVIVSGGSALQLRLARLFCAIGIDLCEGYGLTETSPVIAVNLPNWKIGRKLGTVGPILEGIDVKIAEDGEILTSGRCLMQGYYKDPKLTAEVIDKDGYFHTGDIGIIEENKFLKITDRKKEIFKTSGGKYIAPQVIENKFKSSNLIEQIMVVGENEKFASALISPNFNYLHFYAAKHKIHYLDNKDLIENKQINKKIQHEINEINQTLAEHEKIKRFRLVQDEWTQPTGELSQTLKLKRNFIKNKYINILEEIYRHNENSDKLMEVDSLSSMIKNEIKNKITTNTEEEK